MNTKSIYMKLLSVVLVITMIFSTVSVAAVAIDYTDTDEKEVSDVVEETEDEYVAYDMVKKVGKEHFHFSPNEDGVLVADEPEKLISLFSSPKANEVEVDDIYKDIDWTNFAEDVLTGDEGIVKWMMSHKSSEVKLFTDKDGNSVAVRGASNYNTFKDDNHDFLCDICNYCINGCTDGVEKQYTKDDVASHVGGNYYNADGVLIGRDVTVEIKSQNSAGETITEKKKYVEYLTYTEGSDNVCDVCGKEICAIPTHNYTDGFCDECGLCAGIHIDKDNNNLCDRCGRCINDSLCVDNEGTEIGDGNCDNCGKAMDTACNNHEGEGVCETCGICIGECVDADTDGFCDNCGKCTAACVDATGAQTGDSFCDNCGYCMDNACVNADNNSECDNCKKTYSTCVHTDNLGADSCSACPKKYCEVMNIAELNHALMIYTAIYTHLLSLDANNDKSYSEWLHGDFANFMATGKNEEGNVYTGIAAAYEFRNEINDAKLNDQTLSVNIDTFKNIDYSKIKAADLVGKLTMVNGKPAVDYGNSIYGQIVSTTTSSPFVSYKQNCDKFIYADTFKYLEYYNKLESIKTELGDNIKKVANDMLDDELYAIFNGYTNGKIVITAANYDSYKEKYNRVDEVLFAFTAGDSYRNTALKIFADTIWNTGNFVNVYSYSGSTRRNIEYLLLMKIDEGLKSFAEMEFTNYQQVTYDENGKKPYAIRDLMGEDLAMDEEFEVWEDQIVDLIETLDGFIASEEAAQIIIKLLSSNGQELNPDDYNVDGKITIYDVILSFVSQFLFTDDLMNTIFGIFPTLFDLLDNLPEILKAIGARQTDPNTYTIDIYDLTKALGASSLTEGASEALRSIIGDAAFTISLNGTGGSRSFRNIFNDLGLKIYPDQIAGLMDGNKAIFKDAISKLSGKSEWKNVASSNGSLNIKWNIKNFNDFKDVLSVLFASINPLIEVIFSSNGGFAARVDKAGGVVFTASLLTFVISSSAMLSMGFSVDSLGIYDSIIIPIFEALGLADFGTIIGEENLNYRPKNIVYSSNDSAQVNARRATDAIIDPILAFLEQLSSHPIEKLLSILPNIAMFVENGKLLELLDYNNSYSLIANLDFSYSFTNIIDNIKNIITEQIFKHWYDYLNPYNYVRVITAVSVYLVASAIFTAIFAIIGDFDLKSVLDFALGIFDMGTVLGKPLQSVYDKIPGLFATMAGALGLDVSSRIKNMKWDATKTNVDMQKVLKNLNFYDLLGPYLNSKSAEQSLGFTINKVSTIIKLFLDNLVDKQGNPVHLIDTDLLDFDTLAHLGKLQKKSGSNRSVQYANRWNGLSAGQYYFVSADPADVMYYFINIIANAISDVEGVKNILKIVGLDYDNLEETIAEYGDLLADTASVQLNAVVKNATDDNGKLNLTKLLKNINTNNLTCILVEFMQGVHVKLEEMGYLESNTKEEIDSHNSTIPYLEYDNQWTSDVAGFISEDIDSFVDELLETIPLDLDDSTEDVDKLNVFLTNTVNKIVDRPELLTTVIELLADIYDSENETIFYLLEKATGIDVSVWAHDFGYLFGNGTKPANADKAFKRISAEKVFDEETQEYVINWFYNGTQVKTLKDILNVFGEILNPAAPLLDLIFNGKDFQILSYTNKDGEKQGTVTVKGEDGYNYAILPLLYAMLPEDADIPTPDEFKEMGSIKGLMNVLTLIVDQIYYIINNGQSIADLCEMLVQLMYSVSSNGIAVMINDLAQPLFLVVDYIRPIINIDVNEVVNSLLCTLAYEFCQYDSADEMRQVLKDKDAEIDFNTFDLESIFKLIGVVINKNGEPRKFLDIKSPYYAAMNDIAYLAKSVSNCGYAEDENGNIVKADIKKLDISGRDSLTCIISLFLEVAFYEDNPEVVDDFLSRMLSLLGLDETIIEELDSLGLDVDWKDLIERKGIIATVLSVIYGIKMNYLTNYDWAYILGENATDEQKLDFIYKVKIDGSAKVDDYLNQKAQDDFAKYLEAYDITSWDEDTAVYLVDRLGDVIDNALNINLGEERIGDKLMGLLELDGVEGKYTITAIVNELLPTVLTDENIDKIVAFISDLFNGRIEAPEVVREDNSMDKLMVTLSNLSKILAKYKSVLFRATDAIGLNLDAYDVDISKTKTFLGKVTYYNAEGQKTGLQRRSVNGSGNNLGLVIADILEPLNDLLKWALIGGNLEFFNNSGIVDGKTRRDSAIKVEGLELYEYLLLPLLEALGVKGLKASSVYVENDDINGLMHDMLDATIKFVLNLVDGETTQDVLNKLFDVIPAALYYLNSDAIGVVLENTAGQLNTILDIYNEYAGREGNDKLTIDKLSMDLLGLKGEFFTDVTIYDILELIPIENEKLHETHYLHFSEFAKDVLTEFAVGEIFYNDESVCTYDTYSMRYANSKDKAKTITILISVILDVLEDEANKGALVAVLDEDIYQTLMNVLDMESFRFEAQDFNWLFKDVADKNILLSAFNFSSLFDGDPYSGKLWTREMATDLASNLTQFINDILYLVGLEFNGIKIRDFNTMLYALVGGTLYSDDLLNMITGLLGKIKPLLEEYDPDGAIAGLLKELLDLDVHAWDVYAEGGIYENGREWGFKEGASTSAEVKANSKIFEDALCELLSPLARVLTFILCEDDITFFTDADGLGKNNDKIQLTICGAEGYKYAIVPLFEALNMDGRPEKMIAGKRTGDIYDPDEFSARAKNDSMYAVDGIVHPLVAKINSVMDSTATEILELLPSLIYFINSNGLDTVIKNLLHSVYIIGNAIRPVGEKIDLLVYDETGLNLYKTINLEGILENTVYSALGITGKEVMEIYEMSGKEPAPVDGLEDIDFRLLFSIVLAALNGILEKNGIPFKFTSIAASAVEELTYGYVRSFASLSGRTAYTMIIGREIDDQAIGDLLSIIIRLVLKFLSTDNNSKALVELIKAHSDMNDVEYKMLSAFTETLAWYTNSLGAYEVVMLILYYTVYGASRSTGSGVGAYDKVNGRWGYVMDHLKNLDNPIASAVIKVLLAIADDTTGDVIGSDGIAANGLLAFFMQIINWFKMIIEKIKDLFN